MMSTSRLGSGNSTYLNHSLESNLEARETIMNTVTRNKTRGLVQITRVSEKHWNCSVVFYGEDTKLCPVRLSTREVIQVLRTLGAPAPVSSKESHIVEFFNTPRWVELKEFGFYPVS